MSRACKWGLAAFALLYAAALALMAVGTFGLFGSPRDPLAGVFVVLLGLPWNRLVDPTPPAWHPWLAAAAPLLNAGVAVAVCRLFRRLADPRTRPPIA
jgi:hypothetical protein